MIKPSVCAYVNLTEAPPAALWPAAERLRPHAPLVVMIHGYRFSPAEDRHSPHRHILALDPDRDARRALSWPRALRLTAEGPEGLGVALGWEARGPLRAAYARAAEAGDALAGLVDRLALAARRPVALIGHSLGARVALSALARVAPGAVNRVVLLAAAEFRDQAEAAAASPAGMLARILNITSRENDPFDFGLEMLLRGGRARALGFGLDRPRGNWLDLQIDAAETAEGLARLGYPLGGGLRRACHWSPYLRPGVFAIYHGFLCAPWSLDLDDLRAVLPRQAAPRWSRLFERPQPRGSSRLSPGGA